MIDTQSPQERVLLVGVETRDDDPDHFARWMSELSALVETAGGYVVGEICQKLPQIDQKSLVGKGKLQEIEREIELEEVDLVVTQNELSPRSNQFLEKTLDIRVIDRTQLILDIFAMRAKSREGKLQVEKAQYDYLLPRLIGKGLALSRQGGGIGTRGPGETQLESDRRYIRSRMHAIERELKQVEQHRERTRKKRQQGPLFNIGLVGYTNAGKSTLLTALTQQETYVKDQLFATLDPLTRRFAIHGLSQFTITDTVGFIDALPTQLIDAFQSTLEELREMDLLLHVVDSSDRDHGRYEETTQQILEDLDADQIPMVTVYNKKDQVTYSFNPTLFPSIWVSAYDAKDIQDLKEMIWQQYQQQLVPYRQFIPALEAERLIQLEQDTIITKNEFDADRNGYLIEGLARKLGEG